ncbi:MAG: hemerythrin domain-containing protein [Parvularculaceae bacterium]|nr:hemerythrin domain-containing protein [Parvularculaceae bacterium]
MSIDALPAALISSPLDFLHAEHLRQRQFAKLLSLIADGLANERAIEAALKFVRTDLTLHILDEEISFFPLLRPLCRPEDKIDDLIGVLAEEHREDEKESEKLIEVLEHLLNGEAPSTRAAEILRSFSEHLKGHLALENGVLLPLAKARMTPQSLQLLSQSILDRRRS